MATYLNICGLVLNLAGVILLFCYGMPFRVRTEGKSNVTVIRATAGDDIRKERLYAHLGLCGLAFIILGTAFQVWAALAQRM